MDFRPFDSAHHEFDEPTLALLVQLEQEFGTVELREMAESGEWCIRIVTADKDTEERLPLAALGVTPFAAAGRLIRICGLRKPGE